jgi:hypothetical protein
MLKPILSYPGLAEALYTKPHIKWFRTAARSTSSTAIANNWSWANGGEFGRLHIET